MTGLVIIAVIAVVIIEIVKELTRKPKKKGKTPTPPIIRVRADDIQPNPVYKSKPTILTPTEQKFFRVLEKLKSPTTAIGVQVRVADIITPIDTQDRPSFTRIMSKHIDFVLFNRETFKIIAAIELNDSSHQREKRQERDQFLARSFEDAGVPLIWIPAQSNYDKDQLQQEITKGIQNS